MKTGLKKTTNPSIFYRVEHLSFGGREVIKYFWNLNEAEFYAMHLKTVRHADGVHIYRVTEELL